MKRVFFSKGLVLGIIMLFVGAGFIPSIVGIKKEKTTLTPIGSPGYIQDLIDNASDGDTIYIPSGTYYENIIINKSISLIGEDKNTTIIDGGGNGDVLFVSADEVNISGFTVQNSGLGMYPHHAGIEIHSISNVITGNIICSNKGDGIYLNTSNNNAIMSNNITNNDQDGIRLIDSDNNILSGNIITTDNVCGLSLYYSNGNTITKNDITNNFFAMLLWGHNNIVTGNNITSNHCAGLWLLNAKNSKVHRNNITFNNYYGIRLGSESPRNTITSNNISNNDDGIIIRYHSPHNIISGNIISNNLCGINISTPFNVILKNNFLNNERHAFFSGSIEINLKINLSNDEPRVYFYPAYRNHWLRNYWEGNKSLPVRINGKKSLYITNSTDDIIWDFHIPWVNFDWFPAKEPYDIP